MINIKIVLLLLVFLPVQAFSYSYFDINVVVDLDTGSNPFHEASYWDYPEVYGNSKVDWISGSQDYSRFKLLEQSEFNFLGGSIDANIHMNDTSVANLDGGFVEWAISANELASMLFNSGRIRYASAYDNSEITYRGGQIDIAIALHDDSMLTVIGSNIDYSYVSRNDVFGYDSYLLTGLFEAGDSFQTELRLYDGFTGSINMPSAVPIPPALLLFGSGLIGIVGLTRKLPKLSDKCA